jgi:hypothetical protein
MMGLRLFTYLIESLPRSGVDSVVTRVALPSFHNGIDIAGIKFDAMADPAGPLSGDQG